MESLLNWFALEVVHKKEKAVASSLVSKNYECYLPLYNSRRQWSDRTKVSETPLFSGYVFCRIDPEWRRMPILVTPGVRQFVCLGGVPTPIPDYEINAIRAVLRSGCSLEPCDKLEPGDPVVVTKGSFQGIEGAFVRYQGRERLILTISLIQRSIAVELDRASVDPLPARTQYIKSDDPMRRTVNA